MIAPGTRLYSWVIEERLGSGGMGSVYLARDAMIPEEVAALKVLAPMATEDEKARFLREVQALRKLTHPAIVGIKTWGQTDDGKLWLAMELVQGPELTVLIDQGPMPVEQAVTLFSDLADALAHAHEQQIFHRDLKPANIIVRNGRGVLVDFGVSLDVDRTRLTQTGLMPGTPAYMAPEVFRGEDPDAALCDLYAMGQMLHEVLTGAKAFSPPDTVSSRQLLPWMMGRKLQSGPLDPGGSVPESLRDLVRGLTDPEPDERIATAREVCERLRRQNQRRVEVGTEWLPTPRFTAGSSGAAASPAVAAEPARSASGPKATPKTAQSGAAPTSAKGTSTSAKAAPTSAEPASPSTKPASPSTKPASTSAKAAPTLPVNDDLSEDAPLRSRAGMFAGIGAGAVVVVGLLGCVGLAGAAGVAVMLMPPAPPGPQASVVEDEATLDPAGARSNDVDSAPELGDAVEDVGEPATTTLAPDPTSVAAGPATNNARDGAAGVASVLEALNKPASDDPLGAGVNHDLLGGIGGMIGAEGTTLPEGGLGTTGSGVGGGGSAETSGGGSRQAPSAAVEGSRTGTVAGADPIILGALDRSLIESVIKRNMGQIRYCYEAALKQAPGLKGKVVIEFVINKDGGVSSSNVKSSTMGNASVESCIVGRVRRMQFPEPKGGGIVIISYPFVFTPG